MSGPIKPEDVTPELAKSLLGWTSIVPRQAKAKVAEMANAMIDAGLVSPPCHVTRYLGELVCQGGTLDPALFIGKPKAEGDEHWKGQTE